MLKNVLIPFVNIHIFAILFYSHKQRINVSVMIDYLNSYAVELYTTTSQETIDRKNSLKQSPTDINPEW